jgi:hypothetical protein
LFDASENVDLLFITHGDTFRPGGLYIREA